MYVVYIYRYLLNVYEEALSHFHCTFYAARVSVLGTECREVHILHRPGLSHTIDVERCFKRHYYRWVVRLVQMFRHNPSYDRC